MRSAEAYGDTVGEAVANADEIARKLKTRRTNILAVFRGLAMELRRELRMMASPDWKSGLVYIRSSNSWAEAYDAPTAPL